MASTVTLDTLKARALDYCDMTSSGFPDTSRLTDYVNAAAAELYGMLTNSFEDYFVETEEINLVSGTGEYALPADFYRLVRAFCVSSDRRHEISKFSIGSVHGSKLTPSQGGTVELWYVPEMTLMSAGSDTVASVIPPAINGWDDFIALSVAIRLLIREESDATALMHERDLLRGRIMASAEPRDEGGVDQVQDNSRRWGGGSSRTDSAPYSLKYRLVGNKIRFIQHDVGA